MNKSSIIRTITGLTILAFGTFALLGVIGLFDFGAIIGQWWPILLIIGALLMYINDRRQVIFSALLAFAGVLFLLNQLDLINFNVWQLFWPVIIIGVGLSIIVNRGGKRTKSTDQNVTTISALLSGSDTKSHADDYQGGNISATLGGIELDLREAKIKKTATLSVFVLMGGIELKVPKEWNIQSNVTPILGGVDGRAIATPQKGAPTLIITGDVILGGVEIKH